MRTSWYLWIDGARPGWMNMAIDQTLLDRALAGERWLRLYRWEPGCLSFGRNEPAARRYDAAKISTLGLDVVRRPSGGRAVWHGRELTYAVACPGGLGSLRDSYLEIHRILRDALRCLGVAAELAPRAVTRSVDAGACFAAPAGGEIMVGGRKVVGSAQLRQGEAILQHGSILLDDGQEVLAEVTRGPAPHDLSAPLRAIVGPGLDETALVTAIAGVASQRWPGEWMTRDSCADIVSESGRHAPRFRSPKWTWGSDR